MQLLKCIFPVLVYPFVFLVNLSFESGVVPDFLKLSNIILLYYIFYHILIYYLLLNLVLGKDTVHHMQYLTSSHKSVPVLIITMLAL